MAPPRLAAREVFDIASLPERARLLFGEDAFATEAWYGAVCAAAIPAGDRPVFLLLEQAGQPVAIVPLLQAAGGLGSLQTPYTCLWHPLFARDAGDALVRAAGRAFAGYCRGAVTRLDALDPKASYLRPFLAGARGRGLVALSFAHFGNWYCSVEGIDWPAYLAVRPGKLRQTIRRKTKRFLGSEGGSFDVVVGANGLEDGLKAYSQVYARSWKEPEPFADFVPSLMRACAMDGSLRLGVLRQAGEAIAVQFWIVREGWAAVQKLAHDEARKSLAPGTVLTGLMIRQLLERDGISELDFGRGDDPYKKDWTGLRRQRAGVLLVDPLTPTGLLAIAKHGVGLLRKWSWSCRKPTLPKRDTDYNS